MAQAPPQGLLVAMASISKKKKCLSDWIPERAMAERLLYGLAD
jgi:hypothetical protein